MSALSVPSLVAYIILLSAPRLQQHIRHWPTHRSCCYYFALKSWNPARKRTRSCTCKFSVLADYDMIAYHIVGFLTSHAEPKTRKIKRWSHETLKNAEASKFRYFQRGFREREEVFVTTVTLVKTTQRKQRIGVKTLLPESIRNSRIPFKILHGRAHQALRDGNDRGNKRELPFPMIQPSCLLFMPTQHYFLSVLFSNRRCIFQKS